MTVMESPTEAERRDAHLRLANNARSTVADLKRHLKTLGAHGATLEIARILGEEPERVGFMRIFELLELAPRLGEVGASKILRRQNPLIWPLKRVRNLTARQRMLLVAELVQRAERHRHSAITLAILDCIDCLGEPALASDISVATEMAPRAMGPRLEGLEKRGLVRRVVPKARKSRDPCGWCLTEAGRAETAARPEAWAA